MHIPEIFIAEADSGVAADFERQARVADKYRTRYIFSPLVDSICPPVRNGYIPVGEVFPLAAPKGKTNVRLLPDGAQVLYVTSADTGLRETVDPKTPLPQLSPTEAALTRRLQELEEKTQVKPKANIAVYLHEVPAIVAGLRTEYSRYGLIELDTLTGMADGTFVGERINDLLFGPEGKRPRTAAEYRERLEMVFEKTSGSNNEAAKILAACARELLASVQTAETFSNEHIRVRHIEMDDPQSDQPKRYSRLDLRALEFASIPRREEFKQQLLLEQRTAIATMPQLLQRMEERDSQLVAAFDRMATAFEKLSSKGGDA